MDSVDDVIAHFGVKGMKWGKRKAPGGPVKVTVEVAGKKLKTSGGTGLKPAPEAIAVARARQKAKGSGVRSINSKDLQAAVKRMQLESQFAELNAKTNPSKIVRGQAKVKDVLGLGNTINQAYAFNNSPAGQELRKQLKAASKK